MDKQQVHLTGLLLVKQDQELLVTTKKKKKRILFRLWLWIIVAQFCADMLITCKCKIYSTGTSLRCLLKSA